MATKLPQSPKDHLAKILCDADLYYLGGPDYTANADKLFSENKKIGLYKSKTEWLIQQIGFLTSHQYFTETAKADLDTVKQQNLKKLEQILLPSAEEKHKDSNWVIIQDAAQVLLGVVMAGIALKGFLVPNHFFDGGVTGMSLLAHELYHWNLAFNIILFNLPLVIVSFFSVGKRFAVRMMVSVILLGICLKWLPELSLTHDKLLISIFGGAFLGTGIGLVMRAGAALDGIEVFALYTLKRTSFTITEIILAFNTLIFIVAAFKFNIETALYSILTYFTATRCIDYVVEGVQAYTGVTIISAKSDAIKYQLVNKLGRGITVYKGERGFLPGKFDVSAECDIIFTVITRLELRKLKNLISEVDPKAFIYASTIREASGGILKKIGRH
ncbi:MAG: YitT family protein [Chitinophagaceae bacterium]|nr:YitT family protein [Chitinophagaceae bacterium]MCA6448466.1 YitT family protein [Chitinophagaceae bacterium]